MGPGDDTMAGAYGVAVDPTGNYVAAAFRGLFGGLNGATRVFSASNGAPVVTLTPETNPSHDHWDVTWDNAGNLYTIDNYDGIWRTYSPPGPNQATTVAIPMIRVSGSPAPAPLLGSPTYNSGVVTFTLFGQANLTYIIQSSGDLQSWIPVATNVSASANRPISINSSATRQFFRAQVAP
jgi:YD repeat-containing protein